MGVCPSGDVYEDNPKLKKFESQFRALKLTPKDVGALYRAFRNADIDDSGTIEIDEMLEKYNFEATRFTRRMFSIFDDDNSGKIDFREFVFAVWNYLTVGRSTLDIFTFDLYDSDSSGTLTVDEVKYMLKEIFGKTLSENEHAKAILATLHRLAREGKFVDLQIFVEFVKTHSQLLGEASHLQDQLQKYICGKQFWATISERRVELTGGRVIPIFEFKKMYINPEKFEEILETIKNHDFDWRDTKLPHSAEGHYKAAKSARDLLSHTGTAAQRHKVADVMEEAYCYDKHDNKHDNKHKSNDNSKDKSKDKVVPAG